MVNEMITFLLFLEDFEGEKTRSSKEKQTLRTYSLIGYSGMNENYRLIIKFVM